MKFDKTNTKLLEYVDDLLITMKENIIASEIYNDYFVNNYSPLLDAKDEKDYFFKLSKLLDIDVDDEDLMCIISSNQIDKISHLNIEEYLKDPYIKNVKFKETTKGKYRLKLDNYPAFLGFNFDEISVNPEDFYREFTKIGYFSKDYKYPSLSDNKATWMSVVPHEIKTMKKHIEVAKGNVLVIGLGLGYYPYMIHLKDEVKHIDIIETDKDIIDIFNEVIFPNFPHKEKISIIHQDGFEYLKNADLNKYDEVFIDIYHDAHEGIVPFLKIKPLEKKYLKTHFSYWIDTSLFALLRRMILTLIDEELFSKETIDYTIFYNENDKIINLLHDFLDKTLIKSMKDLKELLSEKSLNEIAKNLNYA